MEFKMRKGKSDETRREGQWYLEILYYPNDAPMREARTLPDSLYECRILEASDLQERAIAKALPDGGYVNVLEIEGDPVWFINLPIACPTVPEGHPYALPHPPASGSRPEGTRGDERTGDERSEEKGENFERTRKG